jgi:hypothetical protein
MILCSTTKGFVEVGRKIPTAGERESVFRCMWRNDMFSIWKHVPQSSYDAGYFSALPNSAENEISFDSQESVTFVS